MFNRPFGAMIKPIFDSMSVRPNAQHSGTLPTSSSVSEAPSTTLAPGGTGSETNTDSFVR